MIAAAIGPVFTFLDDALKRAFPDKTERERIQAQLQAEMLKGDIGLLQSQLVANTEEAKSGSIFVAGWRPFVGWVCGGALAWNFIAQPLAVFVVACFAWAVPPVPRLDTGDLMPVLLGMLGLGTMRTIEKVRGIEAGH